MPDCIDTLNPAENPRKCTNAHCGMFGTTSSYILKCKCKDWRGHDTHDPGCKPDDAMTPVAAAECYNYSTHEVKVISESECRNLNLKDNNWFWTTCYCCCSCFAYGTPIAIPEGTKVIQDFQVGDQVLVAIPEVNNSQLQLSWSPKTVGFSNGTGPKSHEAMI